MSGRRHRHPWIVTIVALLLGGCESLGLDGWLGGGEDSPPLPGERISVLLLERDLEPDPDLAEVAVALPAPVSNEAWPQRGGNPTNVMQHLAAGPELVPSWRADLGSGETDDNLILSPPVIGNDVLYALDSRSTLTAMSLSDRAVLWRRDMLPENEDDEASLGGGVAFDRGRVYATTAFGEVVALDAATGEAFWTRNLRTPLRAAPTVAGGRVFAIGFDNRTHALDAATGETLWTHSGITETAGVLGAASPAVSGELVIVPYSSGELFALRVENGRTAWSSSLIYQGRLGSSGALSDIDGSAVIDGNVVYAVGHGGRLVALDLVAGLPLWEQEVASGQTPWVAGEYLFLLTLDNEVVCLRKSDGRIKWVMGLPRYEDEEDREDPITWAGPVLVGDRLVVAGSTGVAVAISPYRGEELGRIEIGSAVRVPPIAARETLYIYNTEAELLAFR